MSVAFVAGVARGGGGTSSSIDTTGANLLIASVSSNGAQTLSDSNGNTWTALTARTSGSYRNQLYYCISPTVGSGHTFTITGASSALAVAAFSGAAGGYDGENGATGSTPLSTGSITPSENDCVVVTGLVFYWPSSASINSSFTIGNQSSPSESNYNAALAYKIQTTAGAENPAWTFTSSGAAGIAVFRSGSGAPAASPVLPVNYQKGRADSGVSANIGY